MMTRRICLWILFGLIYHNYGGADTQMQVPRVPSFGAFINRITNTTFGFVRGGINIFGRTIDRIINTFGRVEDRVRELLEEVRRQILRGIPELSIPVLDPLHIDKIDFDIQHDTAVIKGYARNVTVKHISKFILDKEEISDLGNLRFKIDLNLTFPYIKINGDYKINGMIGDTVKFFGDGYFWLHLIDFKLATTSIIKFEYTRLRMIALNLKVKLRKLENNFENLMHDKELEQLFNKAVSRMAPEALDMLWPDIKMPIEDEILAHVNRIFDNATVANIVRRLFNIG